VKLQELETDAFDEQLADAVHGEGDENEAKWYPIRKNRCRHGFQE
jgi:hypothetical protein